MGGARKGDFFFTFCARELRAIFTLSLQELHNSIAFAAVSRRKRKMLWQVQGERTSVHREMERLVLPCERGHAHTTTTFDRAAFWCRTTG
jgi:hypothetical protein